MEQMPNLQLVAASTEEERVLPSSWRSFGSIASSLLARAEAHRTEAVSAEEFRFAPVAWAAE
jgi:hypothetical protein